MSEPYYRSELVEAEHGPADETACFSRTLDVARVQIVARLTVDGEPTSKARARFTKSGRAYTPEKTKTGERMVAAAFRLDVPDHRVDADHSFGVSAIFFHGTNQRRDVDNMLKLICDGLTGVAWEDDSQVYEVHGRRGFDLSENARTEVLIYRIGELAYPSKDCENCGKRFKTYRSTVKAQKFCSRECNYAWRRRRRTVQCLHCGRDFETRLEHPNTHCSIACASASRRDQLACEQCGKAYTLPRSLARGVHAMCSQECRSAFWREQRRGAAKGICETCGGPVSRKEYRQCRGCHRLQPVKRDLRVEVES